MLLNLFQERKKRNFFMNDRTYLLSIAYLLSISDKPLNRSNQGNGVFSDKISAQTIQMVTGENEDFYIKQWESDHFFVEDGGDEYSMHSSRYSYMIEVAKVPYSRSDYIKNFWKIKIENDFIETILESEEGSDTNFDVRAAAIEKSLSPFLEYELKENNPSHHKFIVYHLLFLALADDVISPIESNMLTKIKIHYQLDDETFQDLRECAQKTHHESKRAMEIILE